MIACIQRCSRAEVRVGGVVLGQIGRGLVVLLGVEKGDTDSEADALAEKIVHLRIFEDDRRKMNRSVLEAGGEMLVVSQFTLVGSTDKGRRPSFDHAAAPETADALYRRFAAHARASGLRVATGAFGARMAVELVNDGPVTFLVEARDRRAKTEL